MTDAANPAVASARQGLGSAYLRELRGALARGDLAAADAWLHEAHTISFTQRRSRMRPRAELAGARANGPRSAASVVGANSLARIEYVAPKFPAATRNRNMSGWVELEFTVRADGSTGDIVVTNSSPRKTFDAAAVTAVGAVALQAGDARRQAGRPARRGPHPLHGRVDGRAAHKTIPDRRGRRQVRAVAAALRWRPAGPPTPSSSWTGPRSAACAPR